MKTKYKSRLKTLYETEIIPGLMSTLSLKNRMQVPKITKVIVSISGGEAVQDTKVLDKMYDDLYKITGQKPAYLQAKKSIAAFKLRKGMRVGCKVTLRGNMMYDFVDRLVNIALPRCKDFWGLSKKFDGRGNFSMGLKEQLVFPEIDYDKIDKVRGMNIVVVTNAGNDNHALSLLQMFDFPFIEN